MSELAPLMQILDSYGTGAIGTISVSASLLWLLMKYLPARDKESKECHKASLQSMQDQASQYRQAVETTTAQYLTSLKEQRDSFLATWERRDP
jgi:hypothetical protein